MLIIICVFFSLYILINTYLIYQLMEKNVSLNQEVTESDRRYQEVERAFNNLNGKLLEIIEKRVEEKLNSRIKSEMSLITTNKVKNALLQDDVQHQMELRIQKAINDNVDKEVRRRMVERFRKSLPMVAIAKQFYLITPTLAEKIQRSVRMTKEEFLLAFPELYDEVFKGVDAKQDYFLAPDPKIQIAGKKIAKLLDIGADVNYRDERSAYSERVELADKRGAISGINDREILKNRGENPDATGPDNADTND